MELSIIKSEINKALSQSHAKECTYNDLFIKTLDPYNPNYPSRVHNSTLQGFENELTKFIKRDKDFVIYIQHDDSNLFAADCSYELDLVELNTYRFTNGNITIYIVID